MGTGTIVTVVGARPQFVKAGVVSRALVETGVREVLVHTGQHFDANMSDVFFHELGLPVPDHHLGVSGGSHGVQTARMLEGVERVLQEVRPDWLLVYGDTNSTLAGALAAAKLHVPVAHVEAGLRSFNRRMPEEVNRVLTDHTSELLFAPTEVAEGHLAREGIPAGRVHRVGDVMYDAALHFAERAERESTVLGDLGLEPGRYVLATVHRAENTDHPARLRAIVEGLSRVAAELPVILPLHPRTRGALRDQGLAVDAPGLRVVEPLGYLDMVRLERDAALVATDSGGVQKEAYFFGVPCVTLRDETEWVELLEAGWNRLAPPTDAGAVADAVRGALGTRGRTGQLYGDGTAAVKVAHILARFCGAAGCAE
ncbi:non-hydrolyzing UDP-N-acetylglucosamine 2-epimerase [Longimicrobium sp.]|uniref:non-hydrolyzing UDP-N-acetylglucosamine 2-epimerase n=1 Tax=Longimicrobium sp. TaxID=2029185 RepID=UPI003B3B64A3